MNNRFNLNKTLEYTILLVCAGFLIYAISIGIFGPPEWLSDFSENIAWNN